MVGGSMVSSVKSWTLFFGCLGFEGVEFLFCCWGLRPLLQVGEIPESKAYLRSEWCVNFVLIGLAIDEVVVELVTVLRVGQCHSFATAVICSTYGRPSRTFLR